MRSFVVNYLKSHWGNKVITQQKLKEILEYDAELGIFRWKVRRGGRAAAGDIKCIARNKKLLSATPSQSLQAFKEVK